LYETQDKSTVLFILPYTYYVNVLGEKGNLYKVEIYGEGSSPSFLGYTEKENLMLETMEVISPYPKLQITTSASTILYSDCYCTDKLNYIFPDRKLTYYGSIENIDGSLSYLISYNDKLGYVKESAVYPFSIPNHPNPLTFIKEEENTETISNNLEEKTNYSNNDLLKIGIFCSLLVAGVLGLYIAFRKKEKKPKTVNYYDENDYE
ncbi:MAG: hypothetical protein KBS91_03080, partial [Firmicutes bacterium]|nr:hypothetical protein [Candidatus Caballimonas caccae]